MHIGVYGAPARGIERQIRQHPLWLGGTRTRLRWPRPAYDRPQVCQVQATRRERAREHGTLATQHHLQIAGNIGLANASGEFFIAPALAAVLQQALHLVSRCGRQGDAEQGKELLQTVASQFDLQDQR